MAALAVEPPGRPASCSALMTAVMTALDGQQRAAQAAADLATQGHKKRPSSAAAAGTRTAPKDQKHAP